MRWNRRLWRPMTATTPALRPVPVLYRAGHPYAGHRRCVARHHQPQIHRRVFALIGALLVFPASHAPYTLVKDLNLTS